MKGTFSPEFLKKLKDSISMVEVVGEHVVLKKTGANFMGLCPFHNERTPSFSVNEEKQLYHCYGCQQGGDLIAFVQEMHGLSFIEAVEELAERVHLPLPEISHQDSKKLQLQREKTRLSYRLNRFAAKFFHDQLPKEKHILDYLKSRGVTEEIFQKFYLGAAPVSWDELSRFFVQSKAPLELAIELGLIKKSSKNQGIGYFDLFRNRAVFPVLDLKGKVAGFGARGLSLPRGAPDVGDGTPKYLNSSESDVFQKGKLLYGLYQAQKYIREKGEVILVEGYFDVIGMHQSGFQQTVATCGTSLTSEHLNVLNKIASKIIVLFDGDRAGIAATQKAMEVGLQNGIILYGAKIPDGLDPADWITQRGAESMKSILMDAEPLLDSRMEDAYRYSLQGAEQKTQAVKQISRWLQMFTDPVGREIRVEWAANQFQIRKNLLDRPSGRSLGHLGAPSVKSIQTKKKKNDTKGRDLSSRDCVLVSGVSMGGEFVEIVLAAKQYLPDGGKLSDIATHPEVQNFLDFALVNGVQGQELLNSVEDAQIRSVISRALLGEVKGDGETSVGVSTTDFKHAVQKGLSRVWAQFSHGLKKQLQEAELSKNPHLHANLMKEYLDVQRRMKDFDTFYDEV